MATGDHFGLPKITFDRIFNHFISIRNFVVLILFSKWPPAAIFKNRLLLKIDSDLLLLYVNMKLIGAFRVK